MIIMNEPFSIHHRNVSEASHRDIQQKLKEKIMYNKNGKSHESHRDFNRLKTECHNKSSHFLGLQSIFFANICMAFRLETAHNGNSNRHSTFSHSYIESLMHLFAIQREKIKFSLIEMMMMLMNSPNRNIFNQLHGNHNFSIVFIHLISFHFSFNFLEWKRA